MPERIFKYHTTKDLIAGVKELAALLTSATGTTTALKNSHTGFLKESGPVSQTQLKSYFMAGRYEIWLRGQGVDGNKADEPCADLEATNPYLEKKMNPRSIYNPSQGYGLFPNTTIVG